MHTRVSIQQLTFDELTPQTKGVLRKLTNAHEGRAPEFESFLADVLSPDFYEPTIVQNMQIFIARRRKRIVGWCTAHHEQLYRFEYDPYQLATISSRKEARHYLINTYVHPDFRQQGIGTQLVLAAKESLRRRKRKLVCTPMDEAGEKLYDRCGVALL